MEELKSVADSAENLIQSLGIPIEIAHYIIVIGGVRKEWDEKKRYKHPTATYLLSLACCFGGSMLLNLFTGKPILSAFSNTQSLILFSIVWWHMYYCPGDIIHSLTSWKPVALVAMLMKEMIRTKKIRKGVTVARMVFPNSLPICVFLGMIPACGGGFIKASAVIFNKSWTNESINNFHFSTMTKLCLLFSLLYNLQLRGTFARWDVSSNMIVLLQVTALYLYVASNAMGLSFDPFQTIEHLITGTLIDYSNFVGSEDKQPETEEKPKELEEKSKRKGKNKTGKNKID